MNVPSSPTPQKELIRVRRAAQLTLPEKFRQRFHVKEGDYILAEMLPRGMVLKPVSVVSRESAWRNIFLSAKNVRPSSSVRSKPPQVQEAAVAKIIKASRTKTKNEADRS
jgi:bifunctional DNA-binding transcriptional regulator/antitoxin component of YhaV-PrlF toxin-antitoxin module